jgi:hypothetical protein
MVNNLDAASLGTCVTRLSLLSRHGQRAGVFYFGVFGVVVAYVFAALVL